MPMIIRARRRFAAAAMHALLFALLVLHASPAQAQSLPASISDSAFWQMTSSMSEPDGFFRSDNFTSNEWYWQYVIPELLRTTKPGGVYMGVGPDQNFTYIAALKPRMVFILDIRRQNMMLHLMYKAIMEMSEDRVTFLAKLFARPRPAGLSERSSANDVLDAVYRAPRDAKVYSDMYNAVMAHLTQKHGFALSSNDSSLIRYVHSTFYNSGPGITYQGNNGTPTLWDLMVQEDGQGLNRAWLQTEDNYRVIRDLHMKNLIVPVVGDFGGPKALRAIATWLAERKAPVTAFYLSNVEQYLFQSDSWSYFYRSVGTLPLDASSTFIRSVFNNQGGIRFAGGGSGGGPSNLLASMMDQVKAFNEGRLTSYQQVIATSRNW